MRTWMVMAIAMTLVGCEAGEDGDSGSTVTSLTAAVDADGDGFSAPDDCDDADEDVYPGHAEWCEGQDNDCDGTTDEGIAGCAFADVDGDGFSAGDEFYNDCDDQDPAVNDGAYEVCANGKDDNCDGRVDEETDADGDGWLSCVGGEAPRGDCEDNPETFTDPQRINPEAAEVCDAFDNDCDGVVNEDLQCGE